MLTHLQQQQQQTNKQTNKQNQTKYDQRRRQLSAWEGIKARNSPLTRNYNDKREAWQEQQQRLRH